MAIELGLRSLLLSQQSIKSLVPSKKVGERFYDGVFNEFAVQGFAPPYITIHQIAFDPMKVLGGTTGMERTEIDVDCHSLSHSGAAQLAKAVSDYLKDYSGNAGSEDYIDSVLWNDKRHDQVPADTGTDQRRHIISLSLELFHHAV